MYRAPTTPVLARLAEGALPGLSPSKSIEFSELETLHQYLTTINEFQVPSLERYYDSMSSGFFHRLDKREPGDFSKASTATCVLSLIATDKWNSEPWGGRSEELATAMLRSDWSSAELPRKNMFTTAFILEVAHALAPDGVTDRAARRRVAEAERILQAGLAQGFASVEEYPPSAYVTQLAVRALQKRGKLPDHIRLIIEDKAWSEVHRQLALLGAQSKSADPFQLAYAIILVAQMSTAGNATPDQALTMKLALDALFAAQLPDGSWPRSQPLFHYPRVGTAHCYEYEMLVQLLSASSQLNDQLLAYLPNLSRAAYLLRPTSYELGDKERGWSSGHHPQFRGPESWSTASVFHFAHVLDRLLAEEIRQWVFDHFDTVYTPPTQAVDLSREFGANLLDSELAGYGSLKETLRDVFVHPIARQVPLVKAGRRLSDETPMSAIFFGPPGTSKTDLARIISEYLGWPLLTVDPSYFVRNGLDQVQSEASRLFRMLSIAEQMVVLLDEFDEMVRDRSSATDVLSRFLTTAMLPKLATINRKRRLVFIVATNYINNFDLAISRQGRFDLIVQVMPPRLEEKLKNWQSVDAKLVELGLREHQRVQEQLNELTYLEFKTLATRLDKATGILDAQSLIDNIHERCTLDTDMATEDRGQAPQKWRDASRDQQSRIRLPERDPR